MLIHQFQEKKKSKLPIVMLTAYDALFSSLLEEANIDVILVGDSLGNVVAGHENTIPVTLSDMLYHTQCVKRGVTKTPIISDLPFMTYNISIEEGLRNAALLIQKGGAQAVKIEATVNTIPLIQSLVHAGIPVMAHIGFTPQHVYQLGGYKIQGRQSDASAALINTAKQLEEVGCFAILLEMVPSSLAKTMTKMLTIPTIGIGAGPHCDGQVLVTHDLLGLTKKKPAKFVKQYASMQQTIMKSIANFKHDVENKFFPSELESYS